METERIALSQRERDRLKVLHEVQQEHLTQVETARRLLLNMAESRTFLLCVDSWHRSNKNQMHFPVRRIRVFERRNIVADPRKKALGSPRVVGIVINMLDAETHSC